MYTLKITKHCSGNHLINGAIYHAHVLEDIIGKMSIYLQLQYRFNTISIKIPTGFFEKEEEKSYGALEVKS